MPRGVRFRRRACARKNLPRQTLGREHLHAEQARQMQPVHQIELRLQRILRRRDEQQVFLSCGDGLADFPRNARPERAAAPAEHGEHGGFLPENDASIIAQSRAALQSPGEAAIMNTEAR